MARKPKVPEPENHERWLISYADFITLLFAFFVVMYASSQADKAKAKAVSDSVRDALKGGAVKQSITKWLGASPTGPNPDVPDASPDPVPPDAAPDSELLPSLQQLSKSLKDQIDAGRMEIHLERRGLVISLREHTFFPSGTDQLEVATFDTLGTIARELKALPNSVRMEGHTDSVPIHTARFPSNWDLSAARATALLMLFHDRFGVPAERMAVAGYADTAPVASNESLEGRGRNRRVDIVVLNETARSNEPAQRAGVVNSPAATTVPAAPTPLPGPGRPPPPP